jgi:hypothetical protein
VTRSTTDNIALRYADQLRELFHGQPELRPMLIDALIDASEALKL